MTPENPSPTPMSTVLPVVEEVLKAVLAAEHRDFEKHKIDNSDYFRRLRSVIRAIEMKVLDLGLGQEEASTLIDELKEYVKNLFLELCMRQFEDRDDVFDDDDPEEARREDEHLFESLWKEAEPSEPDNND